ncbi:glycosyltransferase family 4 protein [Pseudanabaena sp. FACHB-2040]|uniref:glycosyltransferase family 4 protein n=1 Tax=Pseudanabaena sp. FACHB-2040 TaxID=2692859 RepID=UPI001683A887|nr:glycosyltransferase family 4 protein [Pseudanabaena sp. FACHB-2040]MBD2260594.1 glycosyltransferase family 4 protein [Pseudanabaena sp. FACHB-2040]
MRILHLAKHENSGAGRAALRLHQGLLKIGANSQALVDEKKSALRSVIKAKLRSARLTELEYLLVNKFLNKRLAEKADFFSINITPSLLLGQIKDLQPDIINLHWVGSEFIRIEELRKLNTPLVWTLQDMWPFTGGCHYNQGCQKYVHSCGNCPQLVGDKQHDLSSVVWQRKADTWKDLNLTVVGPSSWISQCARTSALLKDRRVETISFTLDTDLYRPTEPSVARQVLRLPQDKLLILFGALRATDDYRKGFHLLQPALQKISQSKLSDQIAFVVFGSSKPENPVDLGCDTYYLGHLYDDLSLALAYSAATVMVVPSVQESFGQTASEALACGTPVVAFNATGLMDIVDHCKNGYLATPYEIEDLARGITWVLENSIQNNQLRLNARDKAEKAFALELQAHHYKALYSEILNR